MTAEEYQKFTRPNEADKFALYDPEEHTILSVVYKKRPALIQWLASAETSLKVVEMKARKTSPAYESLGFDHRTVDGKNAGCFRFGYTVQDVRQNGEYVLCRLPHGDFSFEMICGKDHADYAAQKFAELLSSVKFKKR